MQDGNYIKINRKILEWEWYHSAKTCRLFLHFLLKANWKDAKFEGTTVPRGSFVSSYPLLSAETKLSINEIRTALKHLTETGEITVKTYPKYSVFTVNNYCQYQDINSQTTDGSQTDHREAPGKAQAEHRQLTTIEEGKKEKKENILCSPSSEQKNSPERDFAIIYGIYPKKAGKTKAYGYYRGWLKGRVIDGKKIRLTNRQMYLAVSRYVREREEEGTEKQFYKGFDTLMNKAILDYVEREEE